MLPYQEQFLRAAWKAALTSRHIFPEYAACEAALESGYGHSMLAQDNNLFGMKFHLHPDHPEWKEVSLPTKECVNSKWISCNSNWLWYPDWAACFADRMATLNRLAPHFPNYKAALEARSGAEYVTEVSKTWSTDPERGQKVLAIFNSIAGDWSKANNPETY